MGQLRKRTTVWICTIICVCLLIYVPAAQASSYGWGFTKGKDGHIPDVGKYKELVEQRHAIYIDNQTAKDIYLTFDNGYEQGYTEQVLDILEQEDVPATFFVTGHYVEEEPELVKRMVSDGHIVGNHSYYHPDFTSMSKEAVAKELVSLEEAVAQITDQKDMQYMRPPRGTFNEETIEWGNELGYTHVFWSLAFNDWNTDQQKGWRYAYDSIMNQLHPGAIILLHTVSSDNAEALERVIQDAKKEGYEFKSLDDLLMKKYIPEVLYGL